MEGLMTQRLEVYKCEICGNIVEVLQEGEGQLVCCGQPMVSLKPKTEDQGKEKHVPVIEDSPQGIKVKVGSVPHPMEDNHYIKWLEVITDNGIQKKFLKPGQSPEASFEIKGKVIEVRDYCNIHGFWHTKK
jgi:superoxide reductase